MNKKLLSAAAVAGLVAVSACASVSAADVTLVFAEENSEDSLSGKVANYFKEQVAELTDGAVEIDVQCSKVLGSETEILDGMLAQAGTVDIERVTTSRLTNYSCPKTAALGLPYLFDSREHFWAVAESEDLKGQIFDEISTLGVTGLSFYEEGFRSFFFKDAVTDIADIAGKKIRVADDPIMRGIVEGLGASPTVISSGELYTSLQSGVVDGAEQPLSPYQMNAFNEVAPNVILDEHTLGNAVYIISDLAKSKLTDEQFAAVQEAALKAQEFNKEQAAQTDEDCMKALEEKGVVFTTVEDKTPYKEAVADVVAENTKGIEDFYQAIVDLAE